MMSNPEFRRNLWLELTPHRLVAAPIILALMMGFSASLRTPDWRNPTAVMALLAFIAVTVLWGSSQAYNAVIDEIRERTWDNQRLSSLSPAAMVTGKLFGSTAFQWYIGMLCLIPFGLLVNLDASPGLSHWTVPRIVVIAVFAALWMQACGFLAGLITLKSGASTGKSRVLPLTLLGLVLTGSLAGAISGHGESTVHWMGKTWPAPEFLLVSLALFTGWLWLGAWRLMGELLAVRLLPWGLPAFTLYLAEYLAGFVETTAWPGWAKHLSFIVWVAIPLAYFSALKERRDWIAVRRFLQTWRAEQPLQALQSTPEWLPVGLLALLAGLLVNGTENQAAFSWKIPDGFVALLALSPLTASLLLFRDIGLLYCFSLGSRPDRAASTALVYWFLLWILLPMLLGDWGWLASPAAAGAEIAANDIVRPAIAAAHMVAVAILISTRLKPRW